jgi:low temperature requirement protein LtrA
MTTGPAGALLRGSDAPEKPTFLELFFDLAYVFALSQLAHELAGHLTWTGAFQNLILLLAMLRIWISTTWITDRLDPLRQAVQLLISVTLVGVLILAVAVPQAFGRYGLIFAGVYVAMHIGRALFLVLALRGHELRRIALRSLFWSGLSAAPWILGAITGAVLRESCSGQWRLLSMMRDSRSTFACPAPAG